MYRWIVDVHMLSSPLFSHSLNLPLSSSRIWLYAGRRHLFLAIIFFQSERFTCTCVWLFHMVSCAVSLSLPYIYYSFFSLINDYRSRPIPFEKLLGASSVLLVWCAPVLVIDSDLQ